MNRMDGPAVPCWRRAVIALVAGVAIWCDAAAAADGAGAMHERIAALRVAAAPTIAGEAIRQPEVLHHVYTELGERPIWVARGAGDHRLDDLEAAIDDAVDDGLVPDDYHAAALAALRNEQPTTDEPDAAARTGLELLASDAFLLLASHLAHGKVRPEHPGRPLSPEDLRSVPWDALVRVADGAAPAAVLAELRPDTPRYRGLRRRLRELRLLQPREPPRVDDGSPLRPGDRSPRVAVLRARLVWLGGMDGTSEPPDPDRYGSSLQASIVRLQRRHGLPPDGVAGGRTLAAVNLSARERIERIRVNLERMRWLPVDTAERRIVVNIPDYSLVYVEPGRWPLRLRAVVGKPYRQTPVLSSQVRRIVLNPSWRVPRSIAVEELLPRLREEPSALAALGFVALRGNAPQAEALSLTAVDWNAYGPDRFPFQLRQAPGPANPLGRVKFMFPNPYDVYLHDTPARGQFRPGRRAFSHGCIRVQNALELAGRLLGAAPGGKPDAIARILKTNEEQSVPLDRPIPIHLLYLTAWFEYRSVQWREDIYGRDGVVLRGLDRALSGG